MVQSERRFDKLGLCSAVSHVQQQNICLHICCNSVWRHMSCPWVGRAQLRQRRADSRGGHLSRSISYRQRDWQDRTSDVVNVAGAQANSSCSRPPVYTQASVTDTLQLTVACAAAAAAADDDDGDDDTVASSWSRLSLRAYRPVITTVFMHEVSA